MQVNLRNSGNEHLQCCQDPPHLSTLCFLFHCKPDFSYKVRNNEHQCTHELHKERNNHLKRTDFLTFNFENLMYPALVHWWLDFFKLWITVAVFKPNGNMRVSQLIYLIVLVSDSSSIKQRPLLYILIAKDYEDLMKIKKHYGNGQHCYQC